MRRYLVSLMTTFFILGMVGAAEAQALTNADLDQPKPSWFQRLWPFHKKKTPPPASVLKGPVESAAARRARETADFLRRMAVCDKLKDIAFQTNDEELLRKAEQLDQRALAVYQQHSGQVASGGLQADERILDRRLGQSATAGQGLLPAQRASGSQASLREE
jgi:hypothetical protein